MLTKHHESKQRTVTLAATVALVTVLGTLLAGCAGDGIELNGKIFDAVGLSDIGKAKPDPEVEQRVGLVIPPKAAGLPKPGEGTDVALNVQTQLPNDPNTLLKQKAAADEAERLKKCQAQKSNPNAEIEGESCNSIIKALTGKSLGQLAGTE